MTDKVNYIIKNSVFILCLCIVFWILKLSSYLLFHSILEIFSIIISSGIFILAWNSRKQTENLNLYFLGISFLFVGMIDLIHTLTYKNMGIFPPGPSDYASQLWIAARYMQSTALFIFSTFIIEKKITNYKIVSSSIILYGLATTAILSSILYFKNFPLCLTENGLTPFKKASEYIICFILLISIILLIKKRTNISIKLFPLLIASMIFTILSELSFTLYTDPFGFFNFLGHLLKICSFYLIYQSLIIAFFRRPVDLLFKKLKTNEQKLLLSNELKTKFFSILAHDLRTPFTGILGFLHLLNGHYGKLTEAERKDYIQRCLQGTELAYNLFENLLTWARSQLESMKYNPEKIGINDLIYMNIELFKTNTGHKKINVALNLETDQYAYADRDMVNLVLRNLISNAIKYTEIGGKISVAVQKNRSNLEIAVSDTGIGMDEEELKRLFKENNHLTKHGTIEEKGAGLGLILVKEFVERNKGEIHVYSEPGRGSTFLFTLPAAGSA